MAIAMTTGTGLRCPSEAAADAPAAAFELSEPPDSMLDAVDATAGLTTTFQVVEGVVYVIAAEHEWVLTPGDSATIPAGVPYRRWNAGDDRARWVELYCAA